MSGPPTGTVTFLFTDLEGSTRRWDEQPHAMQRALTRHDAILREAIEQHGGQVFKTVGDAFHAAFARATDAVAAAVAAQRALAAEPWGEASPDGVRMALHTGTADERDGDYFGPPLNRVARLLEAGHGGQVLLTAATAELVRDRLLEGVQLRDLGEHRLRDLARPEHIFQLAIWGLPADFPALRTARDLRTSPPAPPTGFVGRATELAGLRDALDAATSGRGRLVLVSGEPGVGKTRLAQELSAEAEGRGCRVLWGRCWEGEGAPAFWPWVEALGAYARSLDPRTLRSRLGDAAPDLALLVPHIKGALPDVPAPAPAEPEQARFRLFEGVSGVLTDVAAARPLLLVLDDLHWADKPSLLLLQFLVRQFGTARLLVLGTYRDTDLDRLHPLAEALVALRREPAFARVPLGGLSGEEVRALLEARAGHDLDAAGRALAEALARETEGNPFFIEETLRHLAETGGIARREGRWVVTVSRIAELDIPEGVREVIGRRLSRLSEATNQLLAQAAVVGREFDAGTLERLSGREEDELLASLEEATRASIIGEVVGAVGRYRFAHALIRDTLYGELPTMRRVRLHRRVGEALEVRYARNPEPHLAELAHHFGQAAAGGDPAKAIEYARRAGDRALAQLAYEDAADHFALALQAIELDEPVDEPARFEAVLALADAQRKAGRGAEADASAWHAASLARQLRSAERLARAALAVALRFWVVDLELINLLEEALAALGEGDHPLRARLLSRLAAALMYTEERERRGRLSRDALTLARRLDDAATLVAVLRDRLVREVAGPDHVEERLALATELLHLAEAAGNQEWAYEAHHQRMMGHLWLGEMPAVTAELEAAAHLAEALRLPLLRANITRGRAALLLMAGRFAEGEHLAKEAAGPAGWSDPLLVLGLMFPYREQGRLAEFEPKLMEQAARYAEFPGWTSMPVWLYGALGREAEARRAFERAAEHDFAAIRRDPIDWLPVLVLVSETCAFLGDADRAAVLYKLLRPYAHLHVNGSGHLLSLGSVARYVGLLAMTLGQWDAAEGHFEAALAFNARIGSPPAVARTRHDYATMLLRRDRPGDAGRALALAEQAMATAAQLGMARLVDEVSALARQAEARFSR